MTTQPTPMHFPIDECAKCTVRGDMGGCLATRCSLHESWYARTQNARITELESQLAQRFDAADMATASAQGDALDAVRYRFLRDGEWRDTDLEPFIRLQLNTLWDAKIDAARAAQEGKKP